MQEWLLDIGALAVAWAALRVVFGPASGGREVREGRTVRAVAGLVGRARRVPDPVPVPLHRPIQQVGADLRRLHRSFHREGMRFAKYEGCRRAYDAVLAEAADLVEIDHLFALLPPGDERDRERDRVETLLDRAGLSPRPAPPDLAA